MGKLGPHFTKWSVRTQECETWTRCAPTVKSIDSYYPLAWSLDATVKVFRHYFVDQNLDARPEDVANAILTSLGGYRHPKLFVEVYNEISRPNTAKYVELLKMVIPLLHGAGVKVAGPSWGTGDYNAEEWAMCRGIGLDAIALHCYWGSQGFSVWNAFRYRQFWKYGDPPVLITECGRDAIEGGQAGWRNCGLTPDQYRLELLAYDQSLVWDKYVIGATVFTAAATSDWAAFDVDGLGLYHLFSGTGMDLPAVDAPNIKDRQTVSKEEVGRWASDVWNRAGVPPNPTSAFYKYWVESVKRGAYLGRPERGEFRTENGKYMVQEFGSAILHCSVGTWVVTEGLPLA